MRRQVYIAAAVAVVPMVAVVAIALGLTLSRKTLKDIFIYRCNQFGG